jgi:glycosyltransferase involved in cell wall biosynthesis
LRICLVADGYPALPPFGGIARYTKSAALVLAARGHEVHVLLCVRGAVPRDAEDGPVRLHVRPRRWLPVLGRFLPGLGESLGAARALAALHRLHRFDAVEFPNWEGLGLVAAVLGRAPCAVRMHTSTVESVAALERPPDRRERVLIWAERRSLRAARLALLHSGVQLDLLQRLGRRGPSAVVPHGVAIPAEPGEAVSRLPAVLCVGRLNARKGGPTLLEAIPKVLAAAPHAVFQIAGTDPRDAALEAFRSHHPEHEGRVHALGFVDDDRLARLYAGCAVYASASRYESFGLTFLEAMAHGKPVVGCRAGSIPEVTADGACGRLVPPGDAPAFASAVSELLADAALRDRLGAAGRARARSHYSLDRMGVGLEAAFQRISASASPSGSAVFVA